MYQKVTEIISDYLGQEEELTKETNLVTDLGLSSFDVISLISEFEDAFEIDIPTDDIEQLETIGGIVEYLENAK